MTPIHDLIVDAMRAGVLLIADGDHLRFKAMHPLPPSLGKRIKAHRLEVLALMSGLGADATPPADTATVAHDAEAAHNHEKWSRRAIRGRAAELIRQARRTRPVVAAPMRDAWRERLAICTLDGGLAEDHAEQVALAELEEKYLL